MSGLIAVTGATGFIGSAIVTRLLQEGFRVNALVRSCSRKKCWHHPGLSWVTGDLENREAMNRLLQDAEAVVHCAGIVRGLSLRDFEKVNSLPLRRIADICLRSPRLPRLLYISSLAARHPELSYYALSKKKGEEMLEAVSARMKWTVFRPPAVYGPGDREIRPIFRLMHKGLAPVIGYGRNRFSLLHVHDLAEAVVCWLNSKPVSNSKYELHDGFPGGYSWDDVVCMCERIFRRRILRLRVPLFMLGVAGFLNAIAASVYGRPPMLTPGKVRELAHEDWVCDNTQICRDIPWQPGLLLEDALKQGLI